MNPLNTFQSLLADFNWIKECADYLTDAGQRSILFTDILRKRGNIYLKHLEAGQPPVLVFDYETILDGRTLERPVNYSVIYILDRRRSKADRRSKVRSIGDRRHNALHRRDTPLNPKRRPIVVIDPRAGHGPGIGGSKLDSQIGVALNAGHPVYFILFYTDPEPGQTIADVQKAEVRFLEEVARRHPEADKPAVIGNCQAGWAAALIGADRPDVTGPLVFNGSPLSYWGGVEGANPMRYKGGLCGGVWLASLWSDLGNGKFDGAHLVANFEDLNPANTLWTKQYNVYSKVDTEEKRYLDFEKWWGGFFKMNAEEIRFIVESLFVGNELEHGYLELEEGRVINLKNFKDPIVVFASGGDNITPPQQALNWIVKVYGTVDEIRRNGQVIVYIVHEKIGHLGIFVSGSVAKKEHTGIIGTVEMIEYLSPGLYEMVIREGPSKPWLNDHQVQFVEREMADITDPETGFEKEGAFFSVAAVSRLNDKLYETFLAPWVRLMTTEFSAEFLRQLHPLRFQRYSLSDWNPFLLLMTGLAPVVKENRRPVSPDNRFLALEKSFSEALRLTLDYYRDIRDTSQEFLFNFLYDNSWMKALFPKPKEMGKWEEDVEEKRKQEEIGKELWLKTMRKGGFAEGIVRIMVAIMGTGRVFKRDQFRAGWQIIKNNDRLRILKPDDLKRLVKGQSAILEKDKNMALETLVKLLPASGDRLEALEIAKAIAAADPDRGEDEEVLLDKIGKILKSGIAEDTGDRAA